MIFSMMERRPLAPVFLSSAFSAIASIASGSKVSFTSNSIDRVMVEAESRARIIDLDDNEGQFFSASYEEIDDQKVLEQSQEEALTRTLREVYDTYVRFYPKIGKSLEKYFKDGSSLTVLMNQTLYKPSTPGFSSSGSTCGTSSTFCVPPSACSKSGKVWRSILRTGAV